MNNNPREQHTDSPSVTTQKKVPWLTPGVWGIGLASFLADMGHEVPTALFASFLVSTLGASAALLGLIEGIADGMAGIARLTGGALADDPARRQTTAIGGYTSTAILSALIIVASALAGVLWTAFSPTVAFLYLAAWTLISLVVLMWLTLRNETPAV